jgi:hypothetical protein
MASFKFPTRRYETEQYVVSDETGERKRTRQRNDQLEKCRWVGSAHTTPLAFARRLYAAERKAKQSKAKLGFIFSVSFYIFLFLLQSYLCSSNQLLSTKFPSCAKSPLFLSGASPFDLFLWIYQLLFLRLRCLCHPRVSYSFFLFSYQFLLQF